MRKKKLCGMLLVGGLALSMSAWAAGPTPSMLSNNCMGCHGTDGSSVGPASPTIAGLSVEYFIESMVAFKNGDRPSTIMDRIAKGHTDEEIEAMAKFFAEKPFKRPSQKTDGKKVAMGKDVHKKYCEKCHEDAGRVDDESSVLAGQWLPYLQFAMEDFTSGAREMPKKMKKRVKELRKAHGDAGLEAALHFYASQK